MKPSTRGLGSYRAAAARIIAVYAYHDGLPHEAVAAGLPSTLSAECFACRYTGQGFR